MKGGVYSREKCPICGRNLKDNRKDAVACLNHPEQRARKCTARFKGAHRTYDKYDEAFRFLNGLRWQDDNKSFDIRDWQKDQPLGFNTLAKQWLQIRKNQVRCYRNLTYHIRLASDCLGNRNIRDVQYSALEDFFHSLPTSLSGKTKKNIFTTLHSFFVWIKKREGIEIPEFPEIKYELGWRNTVTKEVQEQIIEEVKRISYHINPKIWFGIFLLACFPRVRPGELRLVKEGDIDINLGIIWIRHTKEGKEKKIFLLEEDIKFVKSCQTALPHIPFFRHLPKRKGVSRKYYEKSGGIFGPDLFLKWWNRACAILGVKGVPLYPGTKHSTATAALDQMTPEEVQLYLTGHASNSFYRYLIIDRQRQVEASRKIRPKADVVRLNEKTILSRT